MTRPDPGYTEPAALPPHGLDGLEAAWSRLVTAPSGDGTDRTWHLLDRGPRDAALTLLCVHGNPSWSYLFRNLVRGAPADVRVIAVDQLDMGFSERTGRVRRLATRVDDLCHLTDALGVTGRVITVAHDWGGPVSLGWAQRHVDRLDGVVLMNTAVHQPAGASAPRVIRLARRVLDPATVRTTAFIHGAFAISEHRPPAGVRAGFLAPYRSPERRHAVAEFVADIPLDDDHPSAPTLDAIAAGLDALADVPSLLLWGAADRVFSDLYLHDLERRLPHADVHRYPTAGHFVSEDADVVPAIVDWIDHLPDTHPHPTRTRGDRTATNGSTLTRSTDSGPGIDGARLAIAEPDGRAIDLAGFDDLADATARALVAAGVAPGDRVALMIPPGIDLATTLIGCWRAGAVAVFVDAGLGRAGMSAAITSADPAHLVGIPKALAAARTLRWPGRRISTTELDPARQRLFGTIGDLPTLRTSDVHLPQNPRSDAVAAVAFTSGATGPSKGVVYTHGQLAAQRDAIARLYDIAPDDRLVAAFAPFALFGPLLGIASAVPAMDVTAPATLTAPALGDAVDRVDGTVVFASPAALVNVAATADGLTPAHRSAFERVRLVLSAGAPVRAAMLRRIATLFPAASISTPYGMTECLPVAAITLSEIEALTDAGDVGDGVCVGHPVPGVDVAVRPLDTAGRATADTTVGTDVLGEIVVRADHARAGYDRLWHTQHLASRPPGWHATGDVGRLDAEGRLWIGGRIGHVISTPDGPIAPVRLEQQVESLVDVEMSAVVGVGPRSRQRIVAVVQLVSPRRRAALAEAALTADVRDVVAEPVAAVLTVPKLPVDRRHNSKIDRALLAEWAAAVLAGGRITNP